MKDGYFGDPGHIHSVIKTDFDSASEEWFKTVKRHLQTANKLKQVKIGYPDTVTHVWCVEYDLPARQRQRKRKRNDGDDTRHA